MFNFFAKKEPLKIGQIWTYGSDNPFRKDEFIATILDIKDGYVYFESGCNMELDYMKDMGRLKMNKSYKEKDFRFFFKKMLKNV